jgi:DNA-directed RNA polymerase specialized sigma24 family protein
MASTSESRPEQLGSVSKVLKTCLENPDQAEPQNILFDRCLPWLTGWIGNWCARQGVRGMVDEDVAAYSGMRAVFKRIKLGKYEKLERREHLLGWLVICAVWKAKKQIDHATKKKRNARLTIRESEMPPPNGAEDGEETQAGMEQFPDRAPSPEEMAAFEENCQRLLDMLPLKLQQIVPLRLMDYTNGEIAQKMGVTEKTIERWFGKIRSDWEGEIDHERGEDDRPA